MDSSLIELADQIIQMVIDDARIGFFTSLDDYTIRPDSKDLNKDVAEKIYEFLKSGGKL